MSQSNNPLESILDVDSHEMVPTHLWEKEFGPATGEVGKKLYPLFENMKDNNNYVCPDYVADTQPINQDTVWRLRGVHAPSGTDHARRVAVMDEMGIERQLIFSSAGASAMALERMVGSDLAAASVQEHNRWCVRTARLSPRLRPVAIVTTNGTVDQLLDDTQKLIDEGIRAVMMPVATPPCGLSPAAPELDRFWAMLEKNNIALTGHVCESTFMASDAWMNTPIFMNFKANSLEIASGPYPLTIFHFVPSNFLSVLTLGGVFEKYPRLRVGMIEFGAIWFGSFAETLDLAAEQYHRVTKTYLSLKPSEYLARNVRVTPFHFERVDMYLERHPNLAASYCYSTDYPHVEGGKDSKAVWAKKVGSFGKEMMQKIFVSNGELLLPA